MGYCCKIQDKRYKFLEPILLQNLLSWRRDSNGLQWIATGFTWLAPLFRGVWYANQPFCKITDIPWDDFPREFFEIFWGWQDLPIHCHQHFSARFSFLFFWSSQSGKWTGFLDQFLGRARLVVESALWSHVCVVVVIGVDDPPTNNTGPPHHHHIPTTGTPHPTTGTLPPPPPLPGMRTWWMAGALGLYADLAYLLELVVLSHFVRQKLFDVKGLVKFFSVLSKCLTRLQFLTWEELSRKQGDDNLCPLLLPL